MEKKTVSNEGMENIIPSTKQFLGLNQIESRLNISLLSFGQGKLNSFIPRTNRTQRIPCTQTLHGTQRICLFKNVSVPR